jgi:hypothetical protein
MSVVKVKLLGPLVAALLTIGVVSAPAPAAAAPGASGSFVAAVDFATLQLVPAPGGCELTVSGTIYFSGTLEGAAPGTTTALVFAPCSLVAAAPPGAYVDVFRFTGTFTGEVDGVAATGPLTYAGVTQAGGAIDAVITLTGATSAVLRADAQVAVGGTYTGASW